MIVSREHGMENAQELTTRHQPIARIVTKICNTQDPRGSTISMANTACRYAVFFCIFCSKVVQEECL